MTCLGMRYDTRTAACAAAIDRAYFLGGIWDIYYIQETESGVYVHTNRKIYAVAYPLDVLEQKLKASGFIRTHRDYLVNCRYIDHFGEKEVFLKNGEAVLLSDEQRPAVVMAYCILAWRCTGVVQKLREQENS